MHTPDLADENFKKLAALFPNAVTETKDENGNVVRAIDADVLRQEISATVVEGPQERYQFTWPDKKKSVVLANQPIAKTLRLDREKSVGKDGTPGNIDTENIYIEGDNLDALKLLQETYLGKVKMIYIDPPYNTGNDFIYEDDFSQNAEEYLGNSGQFDEEGNKLVQNTESNGRYNNVHLFHQKSVLVGTSGTGIHSRMIRSCFDAVDTKHFRQFFHFLPAQAIDNA